MDAGRELDKLVAEKLMGWTEIEEDEPDPAKRNSWNSSYIGIAPSSEIFWSITCYSTEIEAAWLVVEKLRATYMFQCFTVEETVWEVSFWLPTQSNIRHNCCHSRKPAHDPQRQSQSHLRLPHQSCLRLRSRA